MNRETQDYPLNSWYVVAASEEIGGSLESRSGLGRKLALYRQRDGRVAALEDRCSHRALSLSRGQIVDDAVVCAYHGFTFSPEGRCLRVPSQENVPYGADVRAYPVFEDEPFIWVWPGDPRLAEQQRPPKLRWLKEPGWATFGGVDVVAANYLLLHENALDRAHFPFVHNETSHHGYLTQPPPLQIEVTETTVSYARAFPAAPLTPWQAEVTGLPADATFVQREHGEFRSPGLHVDVMDIDSGQESGRTLHTVFIRAFTPLTPASTRVIWRVARNYTTDSPDSSAATARLREIHETSMAEDKPFLEEIQASRSAGDDRTDVNAAADSAAVRAQQIVGRMLLEERGYFRPRSQGRQQQIRQVSPVLR